MTPTLRWLAEWTALMGLLLAAVLLATRFLVLPWIVVGPSMEPSLSSGDRVLVDRWTYRQRAPRPGEIALLDGPSGVRMVKRVAPAHGAGAPLALRDRSGGSSRVVGDNPADSLDSRHFGPVPAERFQGRVIWRYWPLSRAGPT